MSEIEHGTYIKFVPGPPKPKTKVWFVTNDNEQHLGCVAWFGSWRKYAFHPNSDIWFEEVCLKEIADFCIKQTYKHKYKA